MSVSLAKLQKQAYATACARGLWPDTGMRREVGAEGPVWREAFEFVSALRDYVAHRDTWEHVTEELADVVIAAASTAEHLGIDLEAAVAEKLAINAERVSTQSVLIETWAEQREEGEKHR